MPKVVPLTAKIPQEQRMLAQAFIGLYHTMTKHEQQEHSVDDLNGYRFYCITTPGEITAVKTHLEERETGISNKKVSVRMLNIEKNPNDPAKLYLLCMYLNKVGEEKCRMYQVWKPIGVVKQYERGPTVHDFTFNVLGRNEIDAAIRLLEATNCYIAEWPSAQR